MDPSKEFIRIYAFLLIIENSLWSNDFQAFLNQIKRLMLDNAYNNIDEFLCTFCIFKKNSSLYIFINYLLKPDLHNSSTSKSLHLSAKEK